MKRKLMIMLPVMLFLIGIFGMNTEAAVYWKKISVPMEGDSFSVDLDADGYKERIKIKDRSSSTAVYVDDQKIYSGGLAYLCVGDLDKNDDYREIVLVPYSDPARVYRYNGYSTVLFAKDVMYNGDPTLPKLISMKTLLTTISTSPYKMTGNKYISFPASLKSKSTDKAVSLKLMYKIANKKFVLDLTKTYANTKKSALYKANAKLVAYRYPRTSGSNSVVFSIAKGQSYYILNVKLGSKITMMQIKNAKTQKTGWIFLASNSLTAD